MTTTRPGLAAAELRTMTDERIRCRACTRSHGEDAPEIRDWAWPH